MNLKYISKINLFRMEKTAHIETNRHRSICLPVVEGKSKIAKKFQMIKKLFKAQIYSLVAHRQLNENSTKQLFLFIV